MYVIQLVGYKNSGKTTLAVELIKRLQQQGFNIATIKHHGHGGEPSFVENTDTASHWEAGATAAAVFGEETLQIKLWNDKISIERMLDFYKEFGVDITIMEGFKRLDYAKIVLIRDNSDNRLLDELANIQMVYSRDESIIHTSKPLYKDKELLFQEVQRQLDSFRIN
ncbi:molybdopterin-guanine dinucleotide biosynthesis protein B [Gracilibacillus xinjiangensis]|uniref:Molybdopterin-guanine dinucleotide biosynthesis protein B n=1 Tax=Gracilibacillus xinjiangensis TaxID=1193282 RepID=A0ABV8X0A8_9BACI